MLAENEIAALVARARRGDKKAFDALVRSYLRPSYSIALGIVRRTADAEDVAQDALLLAFEHLDTCRDPTRFAAWLFQIVRNQSRNWLDRRRLRDVPALDSSPDSFPRETEIETDRRALLRALHRLGEVQREVVLLHDLEGWTHREISSAVGISEIMSRQHLFQAHGLLRGELEADSAKAGES